ncbi:MULTISPECIES: hypothetical protein [unclassified Spirillospora]|uniref:hypothetical protein n=1 Tax=unclassified Spirillospora TaxID=2642701 RepID=UPI00371D57C3
MSAALTPDPVERWVTALRALITPGLYGADLEASPLLDHPAVRARTGGGAARNHRAEALIAVLEETVETRLRADDRVVARMLLGIGEWSGRPVTERHRAAAKRRNRHWSWERNYRKEPLVRDLTKIVLALGRSVPGHAEDVPADASDAAADAAPDGRVAALSAELVRSLGRRRTAYPLDMSLHQLHSASLLVETRVARYHERRWSGQALTLEPVLRGLREGRSALLLGEPGAGKSVALYELMQRSLALGLLPFPARARDHRALLADPAWPDLQDLPEAVFLLDGLDEVADDHSDLARDVMEMLRRRPTLVTSRLREYEHAWSPLLADAGFDDVYVLLPWRQDVEFPEFLGRLHGTGLLDEPDRLYHATSEREDLRRLVERPLYARMLTFIGEPGAQDVADPVSLYGEYLTKLAHVAGASVNASAGGPSDALVTWQTAAWAAHSSGAMAGDTVVLADLVRTLPATLDPRRARRLLDFILNVRSVRNREVGEFLHYSFFEYLVAAHVSDVLLAGPDAGSIHELFRRDLTREIRHHLIAQLSSTPPRDLRERLAEAYRVARSEGTTREVLAICNLLVYLLSRAVPNSEPVLADLLDREDDPFLSAAVLWAHCHRGVPGSDRRFLERLDADPDFRALCRGYVLYYYGDIERDDGPPYLDNPPYCSCTNTLRTIMDVFERSTSTHKVSTLRIGIDLYTFLDVLVVRDLSVPREGLERLRSFHQALHNEQIDATLWARLAEMIEILRWR